jgi:hypothetical protein
MLDHAIVLHDRYQGADMHHLERQAFVSSIALEIGIATGLSEHQVHRRLTAAERVRDHAPNTWAAFSDGRVDAARVVVISDAVDKLERGTSIERLDRLVVAYAETHTTAELRRWLKRFVARVEPDLAKERAEDERAKRGVFVEHGDDGMAWLSVYGPSFQVAAVDKRLTKEAKAFGADDPRTMQQRRADLFAAWMTTNEATEPAVGADVAVTISAESLAGVNDDPIVASDGSWTIPAAWINDHIATENTFWHRLITDPAGHVLDHTYLGRFAPGILAKAIAFRDGVCQAPGCLRPADQCDLDHREPWPEGPTAGSNMWALCRRHHTMKGHGVITWHLPSGQRAPTEPVTHETAA